MKESDAVTNSFRRKYSGNGKLAGCIQGQATASDLDGGFKNGTVIGTVSCDGSICGDLSTCKNELTGNAT